MGTSSDYPSASACPPDLGCDKVCCEIGLLSAFPPPPAISKNLNRQSSVKKCTSSSPVRTGDWVYWSRKGKSPQAAVAQHPPPPPLLRSTLWCHLGEGPLISDTQLDPCRLTLPQMILPHPLTFSFRFSFALASHYYVDCICVCVCVCVCVRVCVCALSQAHTYSLCSCLIMSLLSHHGLMGFNSWCLEQMLAPVRASLCAWGHKDCLSYLSAKHLSFLFA